jgi:hypothetical protein
LEVPASEKSALAFGTSLFIPPRVQLAELRVTLLARRIFLRRD